MRLPIMLTVLLITLLAGLAGLAVRAEPPLPPGAASPEKSARLDRLFGQLKLAANEQTGIEIEQKIWIEWTTPEDPVLASLMQQVLAARRVADYDKALAILDAMVIESSSYAEAWNQRATIHFLREDDEKSLEDIAETLRREPRHFGALAGRALIRLRQLKPALAIQNIKAAMVFHPYLRERGMVALQPEGQQNGTVR